MNRLHIALSGLIADSNAVTINQDYLSAIWRCGAVPTLLLPSTDAEYISDICKEFDGFVFCGGGDIDPSYYGDVNQGKSRDICPLRDKFEKILFNSVYATGKPILGICRGMQIINVFLGGRLHQHIENHAQSEERSVCTHNVIIQEESLLGKITGKREAFVNSFHHQAIYSLAKDLRIDAISERDSRIEAFHMEGHRFLLGVQWHPEATYGVDESSRLIFREFIRACGK